MSIVAEGCRYGRTVGLSLLVTAVGFLPSLEARELEVHPLERHMGHWFEGSGDWRAPNPDYDAAACNDVVVEYSFTWAWEEFRQSVREEPLEFGETESLVTTMFQPDGSRIAARHDNVFHGDGTHTADVFVLEDGEWQLARSWHWTLAP